jgi:threonine/homoserine/homoserine lactone efflux protein
MPFWMFWGTLLKRRNILDDSTSSILIYTLSAGIGAASLLVIYAFLGVENRDWINDNQFVFMIFYGSVFLMIGLYQAWRNIVSHLRGSVVE